MGWVDNLRVPWEHHRGIQCSSDMKEKPFLIVEIKWIALDSVESLLQESYQQSTLMGKHPGVEAAHMYSPLLAVKWLLKCYQGIYYINYRFVLWALKKNNLEAFLKLRSYLQL